MIVSPLSLLQVRHYLVFYFGLAPVLRGLALPSNASPLNRPGWLARRWRLVSRLALAALLVGWPLARPAWFSGDYQFLSEDRDREPVLSARLFSDPFGGSEASEGPAWHALGDHLAQLGAAAVTLAFALEAAPRGQTWVSRTLGQGTFSCFVLHWWLRPVWLTAVTRVLAALAPHMATCREAHGEGAEPHGSQEGSQEAGWGAQGWLSHGAAAPVGLALAFLGLLLAVQWALSGWGLDLGPPRQERTGTPAAWGGVGRSLARLWPWVRSLLKIGSGLVMPAFLLAAVLQQSPQSQRGGGKRGGKGGGLYLGHKCAAFVPHGALSNLGARHEPAALWGPSMAKHLSARGEQRLCLVMEVPSRNQRCEAFRPSANVEADLKFITACLNR